MKVKEWIRFLSKLPPDVAVEAEDLIECEKEGNGLGYILPGHIAPTIVIPERDVVNHPSHYETGKHECIDVMEETQGVQATQDFCVCNALKYIYRHRNKNGVEDIQKAIWYLNKYVELEERKHEVE